MFFTYILKSLKDGTYYYGSTNEVNERLRCHNSGKVKYTNGHRPYKLHYYETYSTRKEAIAKEKYFKSIDGYKWLKANGII